MLIRLTLCLLCCLAILLISGKGPLYGETSSATFYLAEVMDQFHQTYDVYTDFYAAGNHFVYKGKMPNNISDAALPPMKENYPDNAGGGLNSIECAFNASQPNPGWGGWYFMNGVLTDKELVPRENWGTIANAGINLTGATQATFKAKGAQGGEVVEFFCFGVGRDPETGDPLPGILYPDSCRKISLGKVTLSSQWGSYTINWSGLNLDLSYVLGGFAWVASAADNGNKDIKFYLDEIRFNKARLNESRFLASYRTIASSLDFDIIMRNVAYTYDNVIALLAFLAEGKNDRAKLLADALVYAYQNDRYYRNQDLTKGDSRRLRNSYQGGDLAQWPGWTPNGYLFAVRTPGFPLDLTKNPPELARYPNSGNWTEDKIQLSTNTGNIAWAMLGLLGFYERGGSVLPGGGKYLDTAINLGEWVEINCRSNSVKGGYTGGFEGWEPAPTKITYKATEHNIDLYVAFKRLYHHTGEQKWLERANHAKNFVIQMWENDHFWTGTTDDGETINKSQIPVDIQAWANLALPGAEGRPYRIALNYCESNHRVGCGYDFNTDRDGIWYEGTAHMALAYQSTGQRDKWQTLLTCLHQAQDPGGGLPAASIDGLTTGFDWLYFHRLHVGATAWLVLAEKGFNPFWPSKSWAPGYLLLLQ
ncbi:MAG: hypothetical protein ACYDIC_14595 [Desulfobaccales bacterium]